jgi:tRNA A58 N-methylase Trm61
MCVSKAIEGINKMDKIFKCPPGQEELTTNFQHEIYSENEYNRFGMGIKEGDVVLDCGGNVGIFTQYAFDMGASQVLAYECDEPHFKCYKENITDDRAKCTMGFVGHGHYDLTKIFEQHQIDKVDFAKIDIEGAEWHLFAHMKVEDMLKVDRWAIEFHTHYSNQSVNNRDKANNLWGFLKILEMFSVNGYEIKYEHIHKGWDVVHLYARKQN